MTSETLQHRLARIEVKLAAEAERGKGHGLAMTRHWLLLYGRWQDTYEDLRKITPPEPFEPWDADDEMEDPS